MQIKYKVGLVALVALAMASGAATAATHKSSVKHTKKAQAAPEAGNGVVAVVNDQMISERDLERRLQMVVTTTGLPDDADTRSKLLPQIVRNLIDESLQLQDMETNGITVSPEEITNAIRMIEEQKGKEPGSLEKFLASKNVDTTTFQQQLRAQVGWNKLVLQKVRPGIRISEEEIRLAYSKQAASPTNQEWEIASLALPVAQPQQEKKVEAVSIKLANEMRKKADFDAVARQFAPHAPEAAHFWVNASQVDPKLAEALAKSKPGAILGPQRTAAGYTIIKLLNVRAGEVQPPTQPVDAKAPISPQAHAEIEQALYQQKIELEAQKYLRNLRREAYVDVKI